MADPELFKTAMRRFGAAVTVVAAQFRGERRGLTATAVCSLSADPPRLLACVKHDTSAHEAIRLSGAFSVNLLANEHERLSQVFSGAEAGVPKFSLGQWHVLCTGAPVLRGSIASFDCELAQQVDTGTHTLFIGDVVGITIGSPRKPLGYIDRRYFHFPSTQRETRSRASGDADFDEFGIFP